MWARVQSFDTKSPNFQRTNFPQLVQKTLDEKFALLGGRTGINVKAADSCDLTVIPVKFVTQPYSVGLQIGSAFAEDVDKV